jgi:hypothetical protein
VGFCIDVRSEVFRRALESVDPGIQTIGFAGFFGLTAAHKGFASDVVEHRLPVLLNPGVHSTSEGDDPEADLTARFQARAKRAWGRFKLAAVSSFAFVEATGPIYAGKLVKDALNMAPNKAPGGPAPRLDPALDTGAMVDAAETILRAMSLTSNFARLVIFAGHGANVVNNPFASGLHCGACGGYSGEVNARLLAGLLNVPEVQAGLKERGIEIPEDTHFLAALHDTTTDEIILYDADHPAPAHAEDIKAGQGVVPAGRQPDTGRAGAAPAARRGRQDDIELRSRDWAETRPEWALAGCKAFIAAPRGRTAGKSLQGRAFLHDYDWKQDKDFGVLELIMTAPVVVASWISLQYYGSTVAPDAFGAGNKLLHNVTGGIGVVEGNGGTLRAGLPWQSVHDGEGFAHDPLRLSVCIEAPSEAMTDILKRHDGVRESVRQPLAASVCAGRDRADGLALQRRSDLGRDARRGGPTRSAGRIAILLTLIAQALLTWLVLDPSVGFDDANITQAYARNIAEGHGYVYNVGGERVEGSTSFLWTLLNVAGFAIGQPILFVTALCFVITAATLDCARATAVALSGSQSAGVIAVLLFNVFPAYFAWSLWSLMDAGLFVLAITALSAAIFAARGAVRAASVVVLCHGFVFRTGRTSALRSNPRSREDPRQDGG